MERKIFYKSNKKICGLININNPSNKTIAIICHARYSSKNSNPTTQISLALNEYNFNNFRFDFVSCGESEGDYLDYTISNMVENLNDTLEMLKNKYDFENFILIGCSLGARVISLVDKEKYNILKLIFWYGAFDYKNRIFNLPGKKEKIALKNGYYTIEKGNKLSYEYFKDERKYVAYKKLYKWNIPKLFIHGNKDQFVNYKSSIAISKKCTNSKIRIINNGDHGFHSEICMKEAIKCTIDFINNI